MRTRDLAGGLAAAAVLLAAPLAQAQDKLNPKVRAWVEGARFKPSLQEKQHRVIINLRRDGFGTKAALRAALHTTTEAEDRYFGFVKAIERDFAASIDAKLNARTVRAYGSIPAVVMDLTTAEIDGLVENGLVLSVDPMEVYQKYDNESHPLTGVDLAQAGGYTGSGITVAVIDDGLQSDHPAFGGLTGFPTTKIVGGYDFADNDSDPRNDCTGQSHGTNVAGMLAGNGGGVTGVAKDARLVFLKIQSSSICGQPALDGDLVGAIDWVVTNRNTYDISAISMSLGGGAFSSVSACESSSFALTSALNAAEAAGIVTFAASGNDGLCSQMGRPACIGSVISVGAVYDADVGNLGFCVNANACTPNKQTWAGCSTGYAAFEGTTTSDKVTVYSNSTTFLDILAPSNCAFTSDTGSGTNNCFGGTSAATPFASGVGALAFQAAGGSRSLSRSAMESALQNNGVSVTDARTSRVTPRVDALATVQALGGGSSGPETDCSNSVDDDGDGDVDCADSDCSGNSACLAPVLVSYDFETGAQGWTNPAGNYGWRRDSGGTPSSSTGPTSGNNSTWYWYMETSSGQGPYNSGNADSTVVSPQIPNGTGRSLEFYYHMVGRDIGILNAEVSTNGGSSWTTVWTIQGQQQASQSSPYARATADLSSYSGNLLLRFRGEATAASVGWQNDIAIDDVTVYGTAAPNLPPTADAGPNQTVTDSDNSGAETVSLDGTGSTDSDGTVDSYVWSEGGTTIATGSSPTVSFAVGSHTVTLTVTDDDGATDTDTVTIVVEAPPPGTPTVLASYDFENGTQGWSNPNGTYGWRRDSGGTPSRNTGPSRGESGSTWYWYMETSRNQGPYDSGDADSVLVSPPLGGSNRTLEFHYHMYGSTMGRLNVDVSTNGGGSWTNVWSIQGQQHPNSGAAYTFASVDLSGFSGTIEIRFRGESTAASNGWRSDMAIDSVTLIGN